MTLTYYNLDVFNSTNTHTWLDITMGVSNASGQLFGALILTIVFVMFFMMASRKTDQTNKWVISTFLTSVVGVLLLITDIINWQLLIIPIVGLVTSILLYYFE